MLSALETDLFLPLTLWILLSPPFKSMQTLSLTSASTCSQIELRSSAGIVSRREVCWTVLFACEVDIFAMDVLLAERSRMVDWEASPAFCRRCGERCRHNGCRMNVHNGVVLGASPCRSDLPLWPGDTDAVHEDLTIAL